MGLKHQATVARKWHAAIRRIETHLLLHLPPLWFLTDPARVTDPAAALATLPSRCGVIYRHFGAADRKSIAKVLRDACNRRGVPLLIAADPSLARAVDADGVHWPEARMGEAVRWRGRFAIETASAHAPRAVRRASALGMDAVLYSKVFPSHSPSPSKPVGPMKIRRLARCMEMPIYGLGGIDAQNANRVAQFAGIAAIDGLIVR